MNNLKRIENIRYIFDAPNLLSYDIKETDIAVLKLGRNTPKEYVQLRKENKNLYFGNLTSGKVGERICLKISNKLSTLNWLVI